MLYNDTAIRANPVVSGYQVQLFVGYGETGLGDDAGATNLGGFQSGSGRFIVQAPNFAVTGLALQGKAFLEKPTGVNRNLVEHYQGLTNQINLTCFVSGETINGVTGAGLQNIKSLSVFTGTSDKFTPDVINGKNFIKRRRTNLTSNFGNKVTVNISVDAADIGNRVNEVIGYQVVPQDFINYGTQGVGVTGVMFGGFEDFPTINESQVVIARGTLNDIRFSNAKAPTEIFNETIIFMDSGIVLDFNADFAIQTSDAILITGLNGAFMTGSPATISNSNVSTPANGIKITNSNLSTFNIRSVLNQNNQRTAFIVNLNG